MAIISIRDLRVVRGGCRDFARYFMDCRTGRELGYPGSERLGQDNPSELCDRLCHTVLWNNPGSGKRIRTLGLARTSEAGGFGEFQHPPLDRGPSDRA